MKVSTAAPVTVVTPLMGDVAAFDFDGTLIDGGSVFDFLAAVVGRSTVLAATVALSPRLAHAALVGGTVADQTKERLFERLLAGITVNRLDTVAAEFGERHLTAHLRTDVRRRFDWHRARGDRLAIVSASPAVYIQVAADHLGADHVIATELEIRPGDGSGGGVVTGRYQGKNCRGEEKLRRLRQWIDESDVEADRLWAYGNSRGDLRMLRAADVGVNVGRLGRLGRLRSFPSLHDVIPPPPE